MFDLFYPKNTFRYYAKLYNTAAVFIAAHHLLTAPNLPTDEYATVSIDLLIHALTLHGLQKNSDSLSEFTSYTLNAFRIGSIFNTITTGCSQLSSLTTNIDLLAHLANLCTILSDSDDTEKPKINKHPT